jgi:DNA-binding Lrp family transcriptional regulator
LGYQGKLFLFINLSSDANKSETIAHLKKMRNIIVITELIGPYDLLAIAPVRDLKNIHMLVKKARKAPGVQQIKIACSNNTQFPIGRNFGTILSKKTEDDWDSKQIG